jgi:crotonobetaine/carnitine-CoA ligase
VTGTRGRERVTFPDTIPELLAWRAARDGARVWLRFEGDALSARDVLEASRRYAAGLAERGVSRGDRVAILIGNAPEHLFAWFGANLLGAIAAPIHAASKPSEIAAHVRHVAPRVLVAGELRALAEEALASFDAPASGADEAPAMAAPEELARARGAPPDPAEAVRADDVAVLLGTSGTTGAPKAVMQTHRTYAMTAEAFPAWLGLDARDRMLAVLPLSHVNAQAYSVMGSLGAGAELLLAPRFSASRFWDDARRLGATQFNAVGAVVGILAKSPPSPRDRDNPVRLCYTALALPEAQHRAFEERFGLTMRVGYGLSETTFGTIWPSDPAGRPPYGTMGALRQHPRLGAVNRARVVREDGSDAAPGETGELLLANPATMRGYFRDPDATAAALAGGWFRTGDLVRRDAEGLFTFVARKKEILRRRGENVAAAEIEQALLAHPAVKEAAAIGVPAELGEDDIVAFVSLEPPGAVTPEELRAFVRARLADFKVPSRVEIRDALPRTATERIAKHLLRVT